MENLIRTLRKALGETQTEFAATLGYAYSTVQQWEAGRNPPPEALDRLSEVARDHNLDGLAAAFARLKNPAAADASAPSFPATRHGQWHALLDAILDSGDGEASQAIQFVLRPAAARWAPAALKPLDKPARKADIR